jgi:hypothetical protein
MASCHRKFVEEKLPERRSGCPSAGVLDGEMAAEKTLQSDVASTPR